VAYSYDKRRFCGPSKIGQKHQTLHTFYLRYFTKIRKYLAQNVHKRAAKKPPLLMLEKPDIDRYVIAPFTIQDADTSRVEVKQI